MHIDIQTGAVIRETKAVVLANTEAVRSKIAKLPLRTEAADDTEVDITLEIILVDIEDTAWSTVSEFIKAEGKGVRIETLGVLDVTLEYKADNEQLGIKLNAEEEALDTSLDIAKVAFDTVDVVAEHIGSNENLGIRLNAVEEETVESAFDTVDVVAKHIESNENLGIRLKAVEEETVEITFDTVDVVAEHIESNENLGIKLNAVDAEAVEIAFDAVDVAAEDTAFNAALGTTDDAVADATGENILLNMPEEKPKYVATPKRRMAALTAPTFT